MLAGQRSVPLILAGWVMAAHSWLYSARTSVVSCWVLLSEPSRVGSTRCSTRCTETEVAWLTSEQPAAAATAAAEDAGEAAEDAEDAAEPEDEPDDAAPAGDPAGDEPWPAAGAEAATEPHPASAEHSSTASTVPRTWRGDIMRIGRTSGNSRSITSEVSQRADRRLSAFRPDLLKKE